MAKSTHYERHHAQSLRRKLARGKTPLTPYESEWLAAYEARHPPRRSKPLAELAAEADEAEAREPYEAPAVEESADAPPEQEQEDEVEEVDAPEVSAARERQARADALTDVGRAYAHVVSLHERLSVRAVALLEQVADRQSEQEAQLVDALDRLTAARANAMELEAGGAPEQSERQDRLEGLLMEVAGPELKQRVGALLKGQAT